MDFAIPKEWENFLSNELKKEYVLSLKLRLKKEKALHKKIFPSEREIFKAFELTSPEKTKVIIIGQDPYHNPNQANGLCFSVKKNQALPPSLKNIYKEIEEDLGIKNGTNGDLSDWAKQGVLLINSSLTVEQGIPGSHLKFGWEEFTDHIIKSFNKKKDIVFMLWGKFAINKKKFINQERNISVFKIKKGHFLFILKVKVSISYFSILIF